MERSSLYSVQTSIFWFVGMCRVCKSSKMKHPGGSGGFVLETKGPLPIFQDLLLLSNHTPVHGLNKMNHCGFPKSFLLSVSYRHELNKHPCLLVTYISAGISELRTLDDVNPHPKHSTAQFNRSTYTCGSPMFSRRC